MKLPVGLAIITLLWTGACSCADADEPHQVRPSTGTVEELRDAPSSQPDTAGGYLDEGHDWLYRRVQYLIEDLDSWFTNPDVSPLAVPISPLRIDFDGDEFASVGRKKHFVGVSEIGIFKCGKLQTGFHVGQTNLSLQHRLGQPAAVR